MYLAATCGGNKCYQNINKKIFQASPLSVDNPSYAEDTESASHSEDDGESQSGDQDDET